MDNTVAQKLRKDFILQEVILNSTAVPALTYFALTCFPFAKNNFSVFALLTAFAAGVALLYGYTQRKISSRAIYQAIRNSASGKVDPETQLRAKIQAFQFPYITAGTFLIRWSVIGNLIVVFPFFAIDQMTFTNYMLLVAMLLCASITCMPFAFLNSERAVSEFLKLPEIAAIDVQQDRYVKLQLTPKILLLVLCILVPPMGTLIAGIVSALNNDIAISSIKLGFFILVSQALFFSILNGVLFTRNIRHSLMEIIFFLKDIAEDEGDLRKTITSTSHDEFGELAKLFNRFIKRLRVMIKQISGNALLLEKSSKEFAELSRQASDMGGKTSMHSETVASSAEEMSANLASVAAAMEQSTTNVNLVATATEEMTSTISEIARNSEKARLIANQAVSYAQNASAQVDELGKAAREISKVTETINDISQQTNLLALNATIEAARAGEAGRGFAVVANEIKELAKQTGESTHQIRARIEGIQKSTSGTVSQMEEISKVTDDVNEIISAIAAAVEEQQITAKEIAGNISQASAGNQEINNNINQTSLVSNEIARDISEVHKFSIEMSQGSSAISRSAKELAGLSDRLKKMVDQFKL